VSLKLSKIILQQLKGFHIISHHNSAVSRSQAHDEKRGGWWLPHYVVFYVSEEELYSGYIDVNKFKLMSQNLGYEKK
ncbi:hypothetical protein BpHYR1_051961, partial [Brachionus plicatilis]